jgi:hypothetical protein
LLFPNYTLTSSLQQPVQGRAFALPFSKAADPNADLTDSELRLPLIHRVPDNIRNHFIAMCGEFVGTVLFLYFALSGTQVANNIPSSGGMTVAEAGSNPQQLQYIALSFGFSLAVNAWVFFRISGGLFNPAVSDLYSQRQQCANITGIGHIRHVLDRCITLGPWGLAVHHPNPWWYGCCRSCPVHVSRGSKRSNHSWREHHYSSRSLHRDVLDCSTCLHYLHVGC